MTQISDAMAQRERAATARPYQTPQLLVYGALSDLTAQSGDALSGKGPDLGSVAAPWEDPRRP